MLTILLYGHLGKRFGRVHRRDVKSAGEAIRALCATLDGFRKAVVDGGSYRVLEGGKTPLAVDELEHPLPTKNTLRIVPVVAGAGDVGRVILGAALMIFAPQIAAAFGATAATATTAAIPGVFGITAATFTSMGFSLILGGVAQMLAPTPKSPGAADRPDNKPSYAFDGPVNTVAQGNPVPICYGRMIVGSQVISAGLSVEEVPA